MLDSSRNLKPRAKPNLTTPVSPFRPLNSGKFAVKHIFDRFAALTILPSLPTLTPVLSAMPHTLPFRCQTSKLQRFARLTGNINDKPLSRGRILYSSAHIVLWRNIHDPLFVPSPFVITHPVSVHSHNVYFICQSPPHHCVGTVCSGSDNPRRICRRRVFVS